MISALTTRSRMVSRVVHGTFRTPMFVDCVRSLRLQSVGTVYLIVDGCPAHPSRRHNPSPAFRHGTSATLP